MDFWKHLLLLLPRRPKPALAALYWRLTRRKVRAWNRLRVACADLPFAYRSWIDKRERNQTLEDSSGDWNWRPRFLVLLHPPGSMANDNLMRSIESVDRQIYSAAKVVHSSLGNLDSVIAPDGYDYLVPLHQGDELSETALFHFAAALQRNPRPAILYGDHDQLDLHGRRTRPWFKPDWNQELFLAQDYLSAAVAIEGSTARNAAVTAAGSQSIADLVLTTALSSDGSIVHIPKILSHVRSRGSEEQWLKSVEQHLRPAGVRCRSGAFGTAKVEWPLPKDPPLVSIIVPTKDKLELLRACISSVLERTDYPNFEVMVVDNGSVEQRTLDYLGRLHANPRVEVLPYGGEYNFSAINNFAVKRARGTYLCLLNNDTEVMGSDWLSELMRYAVRADVGAAGAKLLYCNGTIQHAGVVVGMGDAAGHAHRFLPANEPGYFRMPHVAHFVSAVTAACLVVEKDKFIAVGGFDEEHFAVAFNDVDFCLKIEAAGWRNVYVPHAILMHHESKSRGKDSAPRNVARYRRELETLQQRWGTKTYVDPLHNPNLDRYSETFVIAL